MSKFIQKADSLISEWERLESTCKHGAMLQDALQSSYEDIILDTKILVAEFGCEPIIDALRQLRATPNPADCIHLLQKLKETCEFRNIQDC